VDAKQQKQFVRISDVTFVGPLMIAASLIKGLPIGLRIALFMVGIATMAYNMDGYLKELKDPVEL